jgi:hypothetical protein
MGVGDGGSHTGSNRPWSGVSAGPSPRTRPAATASHVRSPSIARQP